MSKSTPKTASTGYTIIELAIVMTIVAILTAIGVPSFKYVTASNRIASEINGLLGDMQFARSEAVKEGQTVTVCASATPYTQCTGSPGGSSWQNGWIVFLDANGNKTVDSGEAILRVQPAFSGTDTFVANPATFVAITYNRMGYAPTGSPTNITINLHDSTNNSAWTRCMQITPIGSPTTELHGAGTPPCT